MIKNAVCYVTGKKTRTFIIFIVLTLVLSCLYSCLKVTKSSNNLEKSLYKSSNSSLSVTRKDGGYFDINQFNDIKKIKGIEEFLPQYETIAKVTNAKVVEADQKIEIESLSKDLKNVVAIEATTNSKKNVLFASGVFTIKKGRNIDKNDRGKILVHEEFAKKNKLKLHDKIGLELINMTNSKSNKEFKFEIIGIFSGKKQEKYTGLSSDFSENMMFLDYETSQKILNKNSNKVANKLTIFTDSLENLDSSLKKIKEKNIDWKNYKILKDNNAYKDVLESVSGVKYIIKIMTYSIMIGGVVVLSLILILWLRERIYEIGILLSIGISKFKIVSQFIMELIFISIPSLILSLLIGNILLKQIIGGFISSDDVGVFNNNILNSGNILDSFITFIQSYSILISIIVLSVVIASIMILIKKPKEILSKIS